MKKLSYLAALIAVLTLASCTSQSSEPQTGTTAAVSSMPATGTVATIDSPEGDDRIYGKWSGEQITTQGDKLADVEMEFTKDGKFRYKANGSYEKDKVEVSQDGTYTIDVDVVEMTFKNSSVKNLKTGKVTKEKISADDYSSVSGTLTSATELYIVSDYGYTISLRRAAGN